MIKQRQAHHLITPLFPKRAQLDAAHTGGIAPLEDAHIGDGETDGLAQPGGEQEIVVLGAGGDADDAVILRQLHGDLAGLVDLHEVGQGIAPHIARLGGEDHMQLFPFAFVGQRQDGGDALAFRQRQQIHHRLALARDAGLGQPPDLEFIGHAGGGEEQHRRMGVGDEQGSNEVLIPCRHAGAALAAAALHPVIGQRRALDIAIVRDGDGDVLALDQRLVLDLDLGVDQFGLAGRGEFFPHGAQFVLDDGKHADAAGQNVEIILDRLAQLGGFGVDLVHAQRGQPLQAQIEDGPGLFLGEADGIALHHMAGIGDQRHQRRHVMRRPGPRHQLLARGAGVGGGADQANDLVDIGHGHRQTDQDMATVTGLGQFELGTAGDDFLAEAGKDGDELLQVHLQWPALVQRQHVDAETLLQAGEPIKLVQRHLRRSVALQFDHHTHAMAVALVADVRNALDALVAHQFGDAFHQHRLVHLIGNFGDDDGQAVLADFLHRRPRPHQDGAAAPRQGRLGRQTADDQSPGGKIRSRHDLGQGFQVDRRVFDIGKTGVDHLTQIVRRDVGGHADRDARRAVDQHIGKARGQHDGLALAAVVIVLELDGFLVDILGQGMGQLGAACLGVAHRRRRIAIDRTEIALPVDQGRAHGEILRHAHQGVIDRLVAMGMVLAHDVADDQRRLAVGLVPVAAILMHRVKNAAMHGLEAVARIGQRAADDHAHGVIEIGFLQFVFDGDRGRGQAALRRKIARRKVRNVAQNRSSEGPRKGLENGPDS